jgi:hypothetical protein
VEQRSCALGYDATRCCNAEVFAADEQPNVRAVPHEVFDIPIWVPSDVAPDHMFTSGGPSTGLPVSWWASG